MNICVYCSSSDAIDPTYLKLAADVGAEIARRGHGLVSGAGSISCMGAVARAARAGGANTVGVIPRALVAFEVTDDDVNELIITETMRERKHLLDSRSDAFLALPGGLGTLEELLEVWVARSLRMHAKPVVVLDPSGLFVHLRAQVDELVRLGFVRPATRDALSWADTVDAALDLLEAGAHRPGVVGPTAAEQLEGE